MKYIIKLKLYFIFTLGNSPNLTCLESSPESES